MIVFMKNYIVNLYQSRNWKDIFTDFIILVIFTILPSLVMLFWGMIKMQDLKLVFQECYVNGEFLLYSVSLLTSSFIIFRSHQERAQWMATITLCLISISYCLVLIAARTSEGRETMDNSFIYWWSLGCFVISVIEFFISLCMQHTVLKDARDANKDIQDNIQNKLNK